MERETAQHIKSVLELVIPLTGRSEEDKDLTTTILD